MNNSDSAARQVQFITAEQTIDLRSRVLRPNQPIEACHYPEDNLKTTFHLGILENNKVLSNGTFMQQSHLELREARRAYRLRGMATDPNFQKQGLGKLILNQAVEELKKRQCDLLWFNARISAEGFYGALDYKSIENIFDIPGIGLHKVMYRWL